MRVSAITVSMAMLRYWPLLSWHFPSADADAPFCDSLIAAIKRRPALTAFPLTH
jgi:hypothetical protein